MKRFTAVLALCSLAATYALAATLVVLKTTEFGHGPTIVFLHSMGGTRISWLPTAKKLLADHHVVMMDLPGHGDSALPDPFSLEIAAETIAQALATQKAESTVVVGQGVGGALALMAAAAHPDRVRGVILLDAALRAGIQIPDQQRQEFLQYVDENYDEFIRSLVTREARDSLQAVTLRAQITRVPSVTIKAYLRDLLSMDASRALKGFKPALFYIGTERHWPADSTWAGLARQLGIDAPQNIPARRIAGAGPLVATEQPDSLAAILREFTARALAKK
jgi:pimeloyl-ACP methyl ester carboxylesterase